MQEAAASKREFKLETEYPYNRSGPVRWIFSHLRRYPWLPLLALVGAILNNLFYGILSVYTGRAFDLISKPNWANSALIALGLAMIVIAFAQGLTDLMRNYSSEFIAQRIERDSRDEFYASLLGKSQTFHGRQRIGDVMARATNDVHNLNLMFNPGLMLILDSTMATLIPFFLIGRIRLELLLAPTIFIILLVITLIDYNRRLNPVSEALREQFGTMNAGLAEAVAGIEVVKANVQEQSEWNKFAANARGYRDYYIKQGRIQAFYLPALVFSLIWAGGFLHALLVWRAGHITLGQVVAFTGLLGTLRFPTFISIFTFNLVQIGLASARRILGMINTETELDENVGGVSRPIRGEVEFNHVYFSYDGNDVLKDTSFRINPGETVAIVGETGSGKTTLTRLINRIFDATAGSVCVDETDVRAWNLESLRSQISTIEQDIFLFSDTIAANIAFGCPEATPEEIHHAAREAQADEFIQRFPEGYQSKIGERGVTLSGGQRQRIAIARAFLTNPRILILDDATSAIDSATEDLIQRAMRRISRERTTFLITHRLSQIRWADTILVLRQGRLVDKGTHEELMERSVDYRRIFLRYD